MFLSCDCGCFFLGELAADGDGREHEVKVGMLLGVFLSCCVVKECFAAGSFGGWFGDLLYVAFSAGCLLGLSGVSSCSSSVGEVGGFLDRGNEDLGSNEWLL